ncbi:MAG: selenocysteine-specific translation elongation factor, partial [Dehalococcoidia bacterium]
IDLALLVVAADEGIMPQTREHLAIIDLLGIASGVVAITKSDLVDEEWIELVVADVEETIQRTSLAGSPLVVCSATTRTGLPELLQVIDARLDTTPPKRDIGRPRLSVDRSFTISGFGTVVTGTLVDGSLRAGQEIEILPQRQRARIRGLQMHRHKVERAEPGSRTAINLAGVPTDELHRGMLVTAPGWLEPTTAADVRLSAVTDRDRPIRHNTAVTFHSGAAEAPAKIRLLDRSELLPGESCWAQVRLAEPLALVKGDSFVVRSPNDTIGGGNVVDSHPKRHRRHHEPTLAGLEVLQRGSAEDAILGLLAKVEPVDLAGLTRETDLGLQRTAQAVETLIEAGRVVRLGQGETGNLLLTTEGYHRFLNTALNILEAFFVDHPLRLGMPREELKSRLGTKPRLFNDLLAGWLAGGEIREIGGALSLIGRQVVLTPAQERVAAEFLSSLRSAPYSPPADRLPDPELLAYLAEQGEVTPVAEGVVFSAEAYGEIVQRITDQLRREGTVTLAQVRDLLATSRKYAQAILEHLDEVRLTRRIGDERVLRNPEAVGR